MGGDTFAVLGAELARVLHLVAGQSTVESSRVRGYR